MLEIGQPSPTSILFFFLARYKILICFTQMSLYSWILKIESLDLSGSDHRLERILVNFFPILVLVSTSMTRSIPHDVCVLPQKAARPDWPGWTSPIQIFKNFQRLPNDSQYIPRIIFIFDWLMVEGFCVLCREGLVGKFVHRIWPFKEIGRIILLIFICSSSQPNERLYHSAGSSVTLETGQNLAIYQTLVAWTDIVMKLQPQSFILWLSTTPISITGHKPDEIHSNYLHGSNNEILAIKRTRIRQPFHFLSPCILFTQLRLLFSSRLSIDTNTGKKGPIAAFKWNMPTNPHYHCLSNLRCLRLRDVAQLR